MESYLISFVYEHAFRDNDGKDTVRIDIYNHLLYRFDGESLTKAYRGLMEQYNNFDDEYFRLLKTNQFSIELFPYTPRDL